MDRDRLVRIVRLAAPIVGGMVSQNILNLVDTAMVGSLGTDALAGVGVAGFSFYMSFAAITGLSSAVQAMSARRLGEGNSEQAATSLHAGLVIALAVGLPLAVLLYFAAPHVIASDDPAVLGHAVPYYRARLVALAAVGANFAFRGFWNGVNRPGLYLRTLLIMHVTNVIVSYVLIFGVGGAPQLGSLGAGVGTAVATWFGTLAYVVLALSHGRPFGFGRAASRPTFTSLSTLVRLSVPSAIQQQLFATGFVVLFWIIGQIGSEQVAAASVLINVTLVALLPGIGLGLAAASLVGQALGRGDPDDARQWGWDVVGVGIVAMLLLGLPMWTMPDAILGVFLPKDPATAALARPALQLVGLTIWFDAVGVVLSNALLGAGAARVVMAWSVGLQWGLFLPAAWLVGPWWGGGLLAVWAVQAFQRALQAVVFAVHWRGRAWMSVRV